MLLYSVEIKAPQTHPHVSNGETPRQCLWDGCSSVCGETHLDTLLVAFEEVGARVPGAVPFEELLGKPAIEALVVLALHISASLSNAVHGDGGCCDGGRSAL